jgi:hypothetical protein
MRITIIILLVSYNLCFSQSTETLDKVIVNCIMTNFKNYRFDIRKDLLDFESRLIEKKYLFDNSGESYLKLYSQIEKVGDVEIFRDYNYSSIDSVPMTEFTKCYDKELISKSTSPFKNLFSEFDKINPTEISPGLAAKIILRSFGPKDYELESVRLYSLYTFYKTSLNDKGLSETLPTIENEDLFINYTNKTLTINHWQNDSISLNGQITEKVKLNVKIREFLHQRVDSTILVINYNTSRKVLYSDFLIVLDIINREINNVNDSIAMNTFDHVYSELSENEKYSIKVRHPIRTNFDVIE